MSIESTTLTNKFSGELRIDLRFDSNTAPIRQVEVKDIQLVEGH